MLSPPDLSAPSDFSLSGVSVLFFLLLREGKITSSGQKMMKARLDDAALELIQDRKVKLPAPMGILSTPRQRK
jgi:hypothetical protein